MTLMAVVFIAPSLVPSDWCHIQNQSKIILIYTFQASKNDYEPQTYAAKLTELLFLHGI
jgi:hypothetical protein